MCRTDRPQPESERGQQSRRNFWGQVFDEVDTSDAGPGTGAVKFPLTRNVGTCFLLAIQSGLRVALDGGSHGTAEPFVRVVNVSTMKLLRSGRLECMS